MSDNARNKYQHKIIKVNDNIFLSLKTACEAYNIDYKTAWARNKKGWPIKKVLGLEEPPYDKSAIRKVRVGKLNFISQAAFARHLKVSPAVITKLRKKQMSFKDIYDKYKVS